MAGPQALCGVESQQPREEIYGPIKERGGEEVPE